MCRLYLNQTIEFAGIKSISDTFTRKPLPFNWPLSNDVMVNVCSVYKCYSNKAGHPTKAAFKIPKDLERKNSRLKILNRKTSQKI